LSANLELVRSIYAAWESGDFSSADWADAQIEYVVVDGPDPGTWSGLAGMAQVNRDFLSAWTEWRIEAEEFVELDDGRVLVLTRRGGRGKKSGLHFREPAANLLCIRDGRVYRVVFYWHRDRALQDLGIAR